MPKYLIAVFLTVNSVALLLYTSLSCKLVCIRLFMRTSSLPGLWSSHLWGTFPEAASRPVPCSDFSHFLLPFRTLGDGKWEEGCRREVFFSVRKESGENEGKNSKRNSEKSANEKHQQRTEWYTCSSVRNSVYWWALLTLRCVRKSDGLMDGSRNW